MSLPKAIQSSSTVAVAAGNVASGDGDAAGGANPPISDAADASASAAADVGTSNAADASASVAADDQPPPSPRHIAPDEQPNVPVKPVNSAGEDVGDLSHPSLMPIDDTVIPSPINEVEEPLIEPRNETEEPIVEPLVEPHNEPSTLQRQKTPSPFRQSFVEETHTDDGLQFSPDRSYEAPKSPANSAGEAEDLVTLTNIYALLKIYVKEVADLKKGAYRYKGNTWW